jgi:hypothetical protein
MAIEVSKISEGHFSVITPILKKKEADKICRFAENYLTIIGYRGFQSSWAEIKRDGVWVTKFSFSFQESPPELIRALRSTFELALKEIVYRVRK